MGVVSQYILQISIFIASVFTILIVNFKRKSTNTCITNLPPGRKGWPFFGETLEFIMAGRNGEPEKFINKRTRLYSSNVFKTSLLGQDVVIFCGDSGNNFLLSTGNKNFKLWVPKSLERVVYLTEDQSIKVFTHSLGFFKLEALQHYVPIVDLETKKHLETNWLPLKQVKAYQLIKNLTFALSCGLFMNITDPDEIIALQEPFTDIIAGIISIPINFPGTPYRMALHAAKIIRQRLKLVINKRKLELSESKSTTYYNDMLSCLLRIPSSLSENVISTAIIGMLFASHDTTTSAISFAVKYLAENPQVYEKVLEEQTEIAKSKGPKELLNWNDIQKMKYSWCVARESMRLAPPAQGTFREAKNDVTYEGFTIPKGWKAYWTVHSTNRNPAYFTEPTKFEPSRFEEEDPKPYSYLPFGAGPHMCKGKEYARLVILVFLYNLVTKFQWQTVIKDEKTIKLAPSAPANGLPIRIQSRLS